MGSDSRRLGKAGLKRLDLRTMGRPENEGGSCWKKPLNDWGCTSKAALGSEVYLKKEAALVDRRFARRVSEHYEKIEQK